MIESQNLNDTKKIENIEVVLAQFERIFTSKLEEVKYTPHILIESFDDIANCPEEYRTNARDKLVLGYEYKKKWLYKI